MSEDIFDFEDDRTPLSSSLTLTGGGSVPLMSSVPSAKPLLFDVSWEVCRSVFDHRLVPLCRIEPIKSFQPSNVRFVVSYLS